MRVLLDEHLPRRLTREIPGHEVKTVQSEGWAGIGNGELLSRAAEAGFEIFLTSDRSIRHQQNPEKIALGIVLVRAASNSIEDIRPLIPKVLDAIETVPRGLFRTVDP